MDDVIDGLNRSAKLFVDAGTAATVEEATARLAGFRMHIAFGEAFGICPTAQAALLTAVNCGCRTFLGGVTVSGHLRAPLAAQVVQGADLASAVERLGGLVVAAPPPDVPLVAIGTEPEAAGHAFAVRATFAGWRAAVVPAAAALHPDIGGFAPTGVLAGALAVAEAFAHLNGEVMAGHRSVGLSLWDLAARPDWLGSKDGPVPASLPSDFWLLGLGHLGQAFLWTIGFLPYADPGATRVFLQDMDTVGASTQSTSILTSAEDLGKLKTRVCADWAERRGFATRLVERRFGGDMRVQPDEPALALCGVDNPQARAILEGAGFATVFEAGLGSGSGDFRRIRTHSFPGPSSAAAIWAEDLELVAASAPAVGTRLPAAYGDLLDKGVLDGCGLTRLAEVAVGAPFVGAAAAAIVVAQIVRMVADGRRPVVANVDLAALQHRSMVMHGTADAIVFRTSASMGR